MVIPLRKTELPHTDTVFPFLIFLNLSPHDAPQICFRGALIGAVVRFRHLFVTVTRPGHTADLLGVIIDLLPLYWCENSLALRQM